MDTKINPHFSPPVHAGAVGPATRFGMEMDYGTLYVVLCGGLPSTMARLCFREDVRVYTVADAGELRGLLEDENGLPADLVIVKSHELHGLPLMTHSSPVDGHEAAVWFARDAVEDRLDALVEELLRKKQRFVREFCTFSKEEIAL